MTQRRSRFATKICVSAPAGLVCVVLACLTGPPALYSEPLQEVQIKVEVKAVALPAGADVEVPPAAPDRPVALPNGLDAFAPAPAFSNNVLHLTNGGFVPGEVRDSGQPSVLRWQPASFIDPFEFAMSGVKAVHFKAPVESPKPVGDFCFELAGGDSLFGSLVDLNADEAVLDVAKLGRLHVRRAALHRIYRWRNNADLVYLGPNGLTGWNEPAPKDGWRGEAGQLVSDQTGATVRGDFGIPARALIEFELSWKKRPDFILALGAGTDEKSFEQAFRFEVWDNDLVVLRETEKAADVSSLGPLDSGPGRAHLLAYLDQEQGRIMVFSSSGKPLAELKVPPRKPQAISGISLTNVRGDVRLERLMVGRWNGETPREAGGDKSRIERADGTAVYGPIVRFDAERREFVARGEAGESRIAADQIAGVFLSPPNDVATRPILVVMQDGSRLTGELVKFEKGEMWLSVPDVEEVLRLPLGDLRSVVLVRAEPKSTPKKEALTGVLEMEGVRLPGRLAAGPGRAGASCLAWNPEGSATASPLRPGVAGRIVYKESKPSPTTQPNSMGVRNGPGVQRFRIFGGATSQPQPAPQPAGGRLSMHLRTGDVIPCEVTTIDETGVGFKTSLSDSTFVRHDKIKAVELALEPAATIRLNKSKRARLLTLPRMQKDSPPTQLIRSKNGDFLRGRVLSMDKKTLQVEVRLEIKQVPRDRVSRIIWLHPDESDPIKQAAAPAPAEEGTRVQAIRSDGIRLTFLAERFADGTVYGKSDVLGACKVPLKDVEQLLIGRTIEQTAAQLAYQQWKLTNAEEPKFAQNPDDNSPGGPAPGSESALVGKPAPDFELDLLGGKTFHLAETKGKVVLLDFWATWCGPCLQAMPQVDRVAREFADQGLQLVAVNLQESPKEIKSMLERHKLDLTVALDRDGVVADKYGATAIPQTVIIDREGNIARLFVGGGAHFDDQLRDALRPLFPDKAPKK